MNSQTYKLIEGFKNPTNDYSPAMMWFWNGDITEEGITYQLEKFREQNIVNFFIHPAGGMRVMYLSDRFFELIKHSVNEAKRLGMKFWIYDENDWPSGMAGGLLKEQYPEYDQEELFCQKEVLALYGMRCIINRMGKFLGAQRIVKKYGKYFVTDVTDLCEVTEEDGCVNVQYQARSLQHEEVYFYFSQKSDRVIYAPLSRLNSKGVRGYVNILKEEVVAKWIEMTHEKYKQAVGDEFGKTVMGVFTDEPTSLYRFDGPHPAPWDDEMAEIFEKEHGYSIMPYMYSLFLEPLSPEEIKARDDLRTTIKHRYYKAFINQVSDWCHANNLLLTGHFGGEEDLGGQMAQGDMMAEAMVMDIPGMDTIGCKYQIDNNNYNIAAKLITSAAKFKGVKTILSETYTTSGHDYRLPEIKRVGNRLMCMGINMIQYMGAQYTRYGSRKGYETTYNYTNPIFAHFHAYNKYVAGIQYLSRATTPDANVLVFNPLRQIIQKSDMMDVRHFRHVVQDIYEDVVNGLLYEGIGFDMFSEDLIENITVKDGYIEAYGYRYDCVVFPDMYYVNSATAKLIHALKDKGVKTIFARSLPTVVVDNKQKTNLEFEPNPVDGLGMEVFKDGSLYLLGSVNWPVTDAPCGPAMKSIIGDSILNIKSEGRVYIGERSNEYCKIYFINNDEKRPVKSSIDAVPGMMIYNAETGEEAAYPVKDGRIELELDPFEMVVVICDRESDAKYNPEVKKYTLAEEISLGDKMEFEAVGGNQIPVPYEAFDKQTGTWEKGTELAFPAGIRLKPLEEYRLRGEVTFDCIPEKVYVNTEIYGMSVFRLNGTDIELSVNTKNYSEYDCKVDVTHLIKKGVNTVEITAMTEPTQLYVQPLFTYFSGDFAVSEDKKIIAPVKEIGAGGWEKQGYPYFSGTGVYKAEVNIDKTFTKAEIEIECEDVTDVTVNGKYAGKILWHPHALDITNLLSQGNNKIEISVTSTNGNLFNMPVVNGILKPASIKLYK